MALDQVNEQTFDVKVLRQMNHPVVVFFSKPGCPACGNVHPHMERLRESYEGRADVLLCDTSMNTELKKYAMDGVPTVTVFDGGEEVWHRTGGGTTAKMVQFWLDDLLTQ